MTRPQPTRRRVLRMLALAALGVPLVKLGRALQGPRLVRPRDLSPVPWIGHC